MAKMMFQKICTFIHVFSDVLTFAADIIDKSSNCLPGRAVGRHQFSQTAWKITMFCNFGRD